MKQKLWIGKEQLEIAKGKSKMTEEEAIKILTDYFATTARLRQTWYSSLYRFLLQVWHRFVAGRRLRYKQLTHKDYGQ
jgi:hypothetical protein